MRQTSYQYEHPASAIHTEAPEDQDTYLPSQDKEREEEDEEVDSSHQFGFLQHPWPERSESRLFLALPLSDGLLPALSAQRALSTPPFCLWEVKSARQGQLCVLSYSPEGLSRCAL